MREYTPPNSRFLWVAYWGSVLHAIALFCLSTWVRVRLKLHFNKFLSCGGERRGDFNKAGWEKAKVLIIIIIIMRYLNIKEDEHKSQVLSIKISAISLDSFIS